MTTRKPIEGVTKDEIKKPAIFKLYDFTKTGTDSMDSRLVGHRNKVLPNAMGQIYPVPLPSNVVR